MIDSNNRVINNNFWKTTRPNSALQDSREPAKGFLRSLWTIWARVLKRFGQPWPKLRLLFLKKNFHVCVEDRVT